MRQRIWSVLLALALGVGTAAAAAPQWVVTVGSQPVLLYARSYALLIGESEYDHGWPRLQGVPGDIAAVDAALKGLGFETEVVMNADGPGIDRAVKGFIAAHGGGADNRLLFYYAGHGHTQKTGYGGEIGYIVPRDAPDPSRDPAGFKAAAISMQAMEVYARAIDAKHALFVFDSCFSGSVFHPTRAIPDFVQEKTARPVRQFITSGAADQPVPDTSIFRREFVAAITGETGIGTDGYLTGSQLGAYLEETVTNYSKRTQTPQYGKIQDPNLDRGDFVFILPGRKPPPPASRQAAAGPAGPVPTRSQGDDAELLFWRTIAASTNPADFREYLKQYPDGRFAGLARIRAGTDPAADSLPARLIERLTAIPADGRAALADRFLELKKHRALALSVDRHLSWRMGDRLTLDAAEEQTLEGCQVRYGGACVLVARDDEVVPAAEPRAMPRVRYAGAYDPEQIPALSKTIRASTAVTGYGAAPRPKAMAFHPVGRVFAATGAASVAEAERQALAACNDDPLRQGRDGPCLLYAVEDQVVLPQRRTKPGGP